MVSQPEDSDSGNESGETVLTDSQKKARRQSQAGRRNKQKKSPGPRSMSEVTHSLKEGDMAAAMYKDAAC
tara:strand:+ start:452 stop:661 length:210 start_codon:yes stop_codon:yes gene_type:complete